MKVALERINNLSKVLGSIGYQLQLWFLNCLFRHVVLYLNHLRRGFRNSQQAKRALLCTPCLLEMIITTYLELQPLTSIKPYNKSSSDYRKLLFFKKGLPQKVDFVELRLETYRKANGALDFVIVLRCELTVCCCTRSSDICDDR